MMYSNRFVVAVKVNGQVLREEADAVALPFGSEYSLLLKNLDSRRAQVKVSIDGQDVAGTLVVAANGSLDLERFIRNGNLASGNKFKFVARSTDVEKHRGIKAEDGLVRVEVQFEKPKPEVVETIHKTRYEYDGYYYWPRPYVYPFRPYWGDPNVTYTSTSGSLGSVTCNSVNTTGTSKAFSSENMLRCSAMNVADAGITVNGGQSNQQFVTVSSFPLETQSHVLVLRLVGAVGKKAVKTAVTVKTKKTCPTCGHKNKTGSFCGKCGTCLTEI